MYDIAYSIYIYTKLFYDTYSNTSVCHCGWTSGGEPGGTYVSAWLTELRGWSRGTREFDSRGAVLRVYRLTRFLTWQRYFNIVSPSVPYVGSHTFWHEHAWDSIIRRGRHARFLANRIESATTWETRIWFSLPLSSSLSYLLDHHEKSANGIVKLQREFLVAYLTTNDRIKFNLISPNQISYGTLVETFYGYIRFYRKFVWFRTINI